VGRASYAQTKPRGEVMILSDPFSELFLNKITKRIKDAGASEHSSYNYTTTTVTYNPTEETADEDTKYFFEFKETVDLLIKLNKAGIEFPITFNINDIGTNIEIVTKNIHIKASCNGDTLLFTGSHYNASNIVFLKLAPKIKEHLTTLLKSKRLNDVDDIEKVNESFINSIDKGR
jgi:hypothetical protein